MMHTCETLVASNSRCIKFLNFNKLENMIIYMVQSDPAVTIQGATDFVGLTF